MGSGSGSLVGILLLADRYLFSPCHAHSRFRPGNTRTGRLVDSLEQWDQTFGRLHPDCIHGDISSEVSTFKLKYCTCWSSGQRVGGVDERHSRPRSPSDTALPVYSTMYMHRVPIQSISAFPLRILVSYVPRSLTCIGTARLLAWELTHIKGFGPGLQKMAFRFPGLSGRHRAPKFSQHASHILVSEAAEMAMLESVSSRSTLSRHLTWWLKSYRGDVHKVRWERTYCLTHMRIVRQDDLV